MEDLIKILVSALAGALITYFVKRDDYRRMQRDRWDADKRQAYSEFLLAANDYEMLLAQLHRDGGYLSDPQMVDPKKIRPTFERMQRALTQTMFLGRHPLPLAAQFYAAALVPSFGELHEGHRYGAFGWAAVDLTSDEGRQALMQVRGQYVIAARKELNLAGAHEAYMNPMSGAA